MPSDLLPQHRASGEMGFHLPVPECVVCPRPSRSRKPRAPSAPQAAELAGPRGAAASVPARGRVNTRGRGSGAGGGGAGGRRAGAGLAGGPSARADAGCWGRGQEASRGPGRPARPRDVARLPGISPRGPGPLPSLLGFLRPRLPRPALLARSWLQAGSSAPAPSPLARSPPSLPVLRPSLRLLSQPSSSLASASPMLT